MATATTHTAASNAPSKTGGASTRNQRTAIGKLVSRKPATALGPARDGARTGSAEPWSGSAFGPTAIGADTRSDTPYFLSGLTTARGAPSWPGTPHYRSARVRRRAGAGVGASPLPLWSWLRYQSSWVSMMGSPMMSSPYHGRSDPAPRA